MTTAQLQTALNKFKDRKILCIGDVMLDRFIYGDVSRVSPEAPIPVMRQKNESVMLGAAGNVARNVSALGGHVQLLSIIGPDDAAQRLLSLVDKIERVSADLLTCKGRKTTTKIRYVAAGQQLLRVDQEDCEQVDKATEKKIVQIVDESLSQADAVLISDYGKGLLTTDILRQINVAAKKHNVPVIADPKGLDLERYGEVTVLKPNALELSLALGRPCETNSEVESALEEGLSRWPVEAILVTRSAKGMSLARHGHPVIHVSAKAQDVFDVSGAGDTGLAAFGLAISSGMSMTESMNVANIASSVAVNKAGTAIVLPEELLEASAELKLTRSVGSKLISPEKALEKRSNWQKNELQVGFTNGCFDILHEGHVVLLEEARRQCDRLIVGLNSDQSIRRLKGEDRPINDQNHRATVLASLSSVDAVILFEDDTPENLITLLKPDLLFKGADYKKEDVVGGAFVESYGGQVRLIDLVEGKSTTNIIEKMKEG